MRIHPHEYAKSQKKVELPPVLITKENYNSPAVQKLLQTPDKFQ
jgi:hypothetical protein